VKQQRNGGPKQSPEALARIEAALESERRQREQLERRLRETEQRLEAALAAVQSPTQNDAALLQLKSQLAAEMEAAESRAQLEQELLALELMANAAEEALAQPAHAAPPQRIIQYIHVPAPAVETTESTAPALETAAAASAAAAPKDFENKLAAAQMAIDAAEARASHNAAQVRKLTEELAAARAEQIRLSAEVRDLADRFGSAVRTAPLKATPALAPLAEAPIVDTPDLAAEAEETIDLTAALADWGAPNVAESETLAAADADAASADSLEDALSAFGDAPAQQVTAQVETPHDEQDALLEDALSAFGSDAPDSLLAEPEPVAIEEVITPLPETTESPLEDSLLEVLEGWGSEPDKATVVEVAPEIEVAAEEYGNLLEIDTLERLESPELPPEDRIAEALGDAVFSDTLVTREDELLEDVESTEVVEEVHRWEPTPAPVEEEEIETIGAWSVLSPEDRLDEAALHADAVAEIEAETIAREEVPVVETPLDVVEMEVPAAQESAPVETPAEAQEAPSSRTIAVLEQAATQRREILAAKDTPAQEPALAPAEDFEPDLASLVRRGAAERPAQPQAGERGGRAAMIDALQQFIGE